ncbi:hypothetical protein XELAEV_18039312mg [Xenopus laevis]|uniref:Uncharacterized protein n=1 Tax=Xenopus laevis TaxID=8355 RepID=A0A974C8G9_XENLA|nr:hypothetical protein XELAEV_18039312mg [Xenopus laevis]
MVKAETNRSLEGTFGTKTWRCLFELAHNVSLELSTAFTSLSMTRGKIDVQQMCLLSVTHSLFFLLSDAAVRDHWDKLGASPVLSSFLICTWDFSLQSV